MKVKWESLKGDYIKPNTSLDKHMSERGNTFLKISMEDIAHLLKGDIIQFKINDENVFLKLR